MVGFKINIIAFDKVLSTGYPEVVYDILKSAEINEEEALNAFNWAKTAQLNDEYTGNGFSIIVDDIEDEFNNATVL